VFLRQMHLNMLMSDTTKKTKLRVLIIDDEPSMVDFIRLGLEYEGYEPLSAEDGLSGLRLALQERPDLIILDLMLPGLNGFEVCRRIRQATATPIIMLTARDEVEDRVQGLDLGADDYLTKPFQFKELAARLRALLRRKTWHGGESDRDAKVLQVQNVTLDPVAREVWCDKQKIQLSLREYNLLYLLMSHAGQVLTRETILEQVWGYDYTGGSNIIEVYVRYLRQKLVGSNIISTVRGVGYVVRPEPD
jgi:two-component system, OmpR family, response regulator MprA